MKTYFLEIQSIVKETEDAVTIYFWHPVSGAFKYSAGQFITLFLPGSKDRSLRRSYSICTSPVSDTSLAITVKCVNGGRVSNYFVNNAKVGDFVEVLEPMGRFVFDNEKLDEGNLVLVGAGSGITPLWSIIKTALKSSNRKVLLLLGNRTEGDIIYKNALDQLASEHPDRFQVHYFLSQPDKNWNGHKGRIQKDGVVSVLDGYKVDFIKDYFYCCGPEGLLDEMLKAFRAWNIPENHIFHERFNAPLLIKDEDIEASQLYAVKVIFEGEEYEYEVLPHQTILDVGLDLEIDLPYSCRAGTCSSCMAKCLSGTVKMDEDEGLTDKEKNEGYVLTCVGHPTSEGVVVEFE